MRLLKCIICISNCCILKNYRFRQDGIEKNPSVVEQSGILPYKAGVQAQKYLQLIRFIPEKTSRLLENTMTDIEKVNLIKTHTI